MDSNGCNTTKHKLGSSKGEVNESKRRIGQAGDDTMAQSEQVGLEHQYLPGLCTNTKMSQLKTKVEELIEPFMKYHIMKNYPKVKMFRVGAIRSKGGRSQYELTGVYHCNYLQDVVDKRIQDEQPFSIILALDEF